MLNDAEVQDPRAMTPDTAEFPRDVQWPSAAPWSDDENGIIEAVSHPPSDLNTQDQFYE